MLFLVPSLSYNKCVRVITLELAWIYTKDDFWFYAARKINNELLYDHLIYHDIDYLHVCIVD